VHSSHYYRPSVCGSAVLEPRVTVGGVMDIHPGLVVRWPRRWSLSLSLSPSL
jgi:hypothetical protein